MKLASTLGFMVLLFGVFILQVRNESRVTKHESLLDLDGVKSLVVRVGENEYSFEHDPSSSLWTRQIKEGDKKISISNDAWLGIKILERQERPSKPNREFNHLLKLLDESTNYLKVNYNDGTLTHWKIGSVLYGTQERWLLVESGPNQRPSQTFNEGDLLRVDFSGTQNLLAE